MGSGVKIAVDVGGTFTDVVGVDEGSGEVIRLKVLTTPRDPSEGVIAGISKAIEVLRRVRGEGDGVRVDVVVHATTIGTNTFLGQVGLDVPKVGLITTEGFRDLLEIGRQRRPELYNVFFEKPKPLVPRRLRLTIPERVGPGGQVITPLDEGKVRDAAKVFREEGVESVAICFLHSYANPAHEARAKEILVEELPGKYVVASHEVDPEYREFERLSTTVVNAALMPVLTKYFAKLDAELRRFGVSGDRLLIMKSDGGFAKPSEAGRVPASTIESGPAAGVIAAAHLAKELGIRNVLSFDMGGTTAKISTIVNGVPEVTEEFEVGGVVHKGRLIKGSGYVVRYPHIDLVEVSAGGGTIAWVDEAGHLRVGPYSAGSDPGPACYGRGGTEPTVTDANLILGRLGEALAGGEVMVRKDLAVKAFEERICGPADLGLEEAAHGVIRLANTEMGRAIRIATVEKGYDPREFTLIAFGGAGPMHACELAEELGVTKVVIPQAPGVFSALGLLLADYRHEFKASVLRSTTELSDGELEEIYASLEAKALETLSREGVSKDDVVMVRYADLRYVKQSYELSVEAPRPIPEGGVAKLREAFDRRHEEIYGYSMSDEVMVVKVRVTAVGKVRKPSLRVVKEAMGGGGDALVGTREAFFGRTGWVEAKVFRRAALPPGSVIAGPAMIEEYDSVTVVPPGWACRVDGLGNLLLEFRGDES